MKLVLLPATATDEATRDKVLAYAERARVRIGWMFDGDYPEPSDEMKPFVFALMTRAVEKDDDDAVATLKKLFPPRAA
jgi:hypothetical protein